MIGCWQDLQRLAADSEAVLVLLSHACASVSNAKLPISSRSSALNALQKMLLGDLAADPAEVLELVLLPLLGRSSEDVAARSGMPSPREAQIGDDDDDEGAALVCRVLSLFCRFVLQFAHIEHRPTDGAMAGECPWCIPSEVFVRNVWPRLIVAPLKPFMAAASSSLGERGPGNGEESIVRESCLQNLLNILQVIHAASHPLETANSPAPSTAADADAASPPWWWNEMLHVGGLPESILGAFVERQRASSLSARPRPSLPLAQSGAVCGGAAEGDLANSPGNALASPPGTLQSEQEFGVSPCAESVSVQEGSPQLLPPAPFIPHPNGSTPPLPPQDDSEHEGKDGFDGEDPFAPTSEFDPQALKDLEDASFIQ